KALAYRPFEAEAMFFLGDLRLAPSFDIESAEADLKQAVLLANASGYDEVVANAWVSLVGVAWGSHRFKQADEWAQHALSAIDRLGGDELLRAKLHMFLGNVFSLEGQYEKAIAAQQLVVSIRERLLGSEHPLVARSLNNLAAPLIALGTYDQATKYLERSIAIYDKSLGPDRPDVVRPILHLSVVFFKRGECDKSLAYAGRALITSERAFGPVHSLVATALERSGNALVCLGRYEEGLAQLRRAVTIRDQTVGSNSPSFAYALTELGLALRRQGQPREALHQYLGAREIGKHGPLPGLVTGAEEGIGPAGLDLGNPVAAIAPFERAVKSYEQPPAVTPLELPSARFGLAR